MRKHTSPTQQIHQTFRGSVGQEETPWLVAERRTWQLLYIPTTRRSVLLLLRATGVRRPLLHFVEFVYGMSIVYRASKTVGSRCTARCRAKNVGMDIGRASNIELTARRKALFSIVYSDSVRGGSDPGLGSKEIKQFSSLSYPSISLTHVLCMLL